MHESYLGCDSVAWQLLTHNNPNEHLTLRRQKHAALAACKRVMQSELVLSTAVFTAMTVTGLVGVFGRLSAFCPSLGGPMLPVASAKCV